MERKINGKTLKEVQKELQADFSPNELLINRYGFHYLPEEKIRERLDQAVGIFNYDYEISSPQIVLVGTRPHIALSGCLSIKDDDGNVVTKKSACGGTQIIMINDSGEAASLKNDLDSAASDVFKRCCKKLGIGEKQLRQLRGSNNQKDSNFSKETHELSLFKIKFKEKFSALGKNGYAAKVEHEGAEYKLVIWSNAVPLIEKHYPINEFMDKCKPGITISFYGYKDVFVSRNGNKENQIVFEKPFSGEEA